MAKKLKKQKKGMSPKAKFTLAHSFKGLISNQSCIDGSYESPWWVASIFLVFSVVLPLVPTLVRLGNVNGGAYLTSGTYGIEKQMTAFAFDQKQEDVDLIVKGGLLHYYKNGELDDSKWAKPDSAYFENPACGEWSYINDNTGEYELKVFLWNLKGNALKGAVNKAASLKYIQGTVEYSTDKADKKYTPNMVFFTPDTFAVALYKSHKTNRVQTTNGGLDWTNTGKTGLITRLLKKSIKDNQWDGRVLDRDLFINTYSNDTYKALVKISNETYLHQRTVTQWQTTGIYAGIYAGVILFLGLMIFVLTRGKNNPFRYLNVWHCEKIAWWASASPAILGTILALIFGTNAIGQISFVLLVSLRVMWLSMKQLRPSYAGQ